MVKILEKIKRGTNRFLEIFGVQVLTENHLQNLNAKAQQFDAHKRIIDCKNLNDYSRNVLHQGVQFSYSQVQQDIVCLMLNENLQGGYFVEFGAAGGISGSNTFLLESKYNWTGIVAEPAQIYKSELDKNRRCKIDNRCVFGESGHSVEFLETKNSMLSTIVGYESGDLLAKDRKKRKRYRVETVSLNDLLEDHGAPNHINYLSVDTEGTELEILKSLNFDKYSFTFMSIEHNIQKREILIEEFLSQLGYRRILRNFSQMDSWFVSAKFDVSKYFNDDPI